MSEFLNATLALVVTIALAAHTLALLVLMRLLRKDGEPVFPPTITHVWANSASPSASTVQVSVKNEEPPKPSASQPAKKSAQAQCEYCGADITGEPLRGIVSDEGVFMVYRCTACRQETAILATD